MAKQEQSPNADQKKIPPPPEMPPLIIIRAGHPPPMREVLDFDDLPLESKKK